MANEKPTAHEVIKRLEEIDNGVYLNDFHREWNEQCMKENARVQSMRFSHAFMKLLVCQGLGSFFSGGGFRQPELFHYLCLISKWR